MTSAVGANIVVLVVVIVVAIVCAPEKMRADFRLPSKEIARAGIMELRRKPGLSLRRHARMASEADASVAAVRAAET